MLTLSSSRKRTWNFFSANKRYTILETGLVLLSVCLFKFNSAWFFFFLVFLNILCMFAYSLWYHSFSFQFQSSEYTIFRRLFLNVFLLCEVIFQFLYNIQNVKYFSMVHQMLQLAWVQLHRTMHSVSEYLLPKWINTKLIWYSEWLIEILNEIDLHMTTIKYRSHSILVIYDVQLLIRELLFRAIFKREYAAVNSASVKYTNLSYFTLVAIETSERLLWKLNSYLCSGYRGYSITLR